MPVLISTLSYSTCKKLAVSRITEAKALLNARQYSGAYYLCGYSVEMALKAFYCKRVRKGAFPPEKKIYNKLYSHDLNSLLEASGLKAEFDKETGQRANVNLLNSWSVVKDWTEASRYVEVKKREALPMVSSSDKVLQWIMTLW